MYNVDIVQYSCSEVATIPGTQYAVLLYLYLWSGLALDVLPI